MRMPATELQGEVASGIWTGHKKAKENIKY